jgi:hypothetical protein
MAKDVEHFFMHLLAIYIYSFENCLFSSFAHLVNGLFILCSICLLSSLYILVIDPLSDVQLAKIFLPFCSCRFSEVAVSFAVQ